VGPGAMYDVLNQGRIDVQRVRVAVAGLTIPRAADGRLMLAVDVSAWLRPDAVLLVFDAGYDLARLAFLLADLPVEVLGRLR
jgi:DDE superfamily endonuclease